MYFSIDKMSDKIKIYDDFDNFEYSDSETEYTEREKSLLKKVTKSRKKNVVEKKEVLRFDEEEESSESENNYDVIENSDLEENNFHDDIPDSKAWGNKRSAYYNTDFVDQDYSTYNEQEEEQALQEEEEAKAIQQRLAQELDEADFNLEVFSSEFSSSGQTSSVNLSQLKNTKLRTDLMDLSQREKLLIFEKDSPEFIGLVHDFRKNIKESDEFLQPLMEYAKMKNINLPAFQFIETINEIALNYLTNISFYLLLKAKRITVKKHPVLKRLVQMRKLLLQMNAKLEHTIKPQLMSLKEEIESGTNITIYPNNTQMKKPRASDDFVTFKNDNLNEESDNEDIINEDENDEVEKRGINYQISKNKGLTPHRKKELRNPRVKHRNKFRKALIRRKGAVRTVRTENKRYNGEISGIKANVKKGIKIKS